MSSIIDSLAKLAEKFSQKYPGEANGVATLDGSSKVVEDPGSAAYTKGGASGIASLDANQNVVEPIAAGGSVGLKVKVIEIGDWDMSTATGVSSTTVAHGLTLANIRAISVIIRGDVGLNISKDLNLINGSGTGRNGVRADLTNITMNRETSGEFDNVNYDATSYNRGWVTIWYV